MITDRRGAKPAAFALLAGAVAAWAAWSLGQPQDEPATRTAARAGAYEAAAPRANEPRSFALREAGPSPVPTVGTTTLDAMLADPWDALVGAIRSLGRLGTPAALLRLTDMAGESNPALQALCSAALGTTLSRQALLDALRDADPQVARAAAQALGRAPGSDAYAALADAVRSGEASVRGSALQALVSSGAPEGLTLAHAALLGSDAALGRAAAESLLRLDTPQARALVLDAARSNDAALRASVAQTLALQDRPDANALKTMLALASDAQPQVRQPSLAALAQVGTAEAIAPVIESARAGAPEDRAYALGLLGNVPDARAGELIAAALDDPSPQVAAAALNAARYRLGAEADNAIATRLIETNAPAEVKQAAAQALWQHGGPLARLYALQITEQLGDPAQRIDP